MRTRVLAVVTALVLLLGFLGVDECSADSGNSCNLESAQTGDILVEGGRGHWIYWYHAGMWDARLYKGSKTDKCIWSAMPRIGLCLQSPAEFLACDQCALLGVQANQSQRIAAADYCRQVMEAGDRSWYLLTLSGDTERVTCSKLVADAYLSQRLVLASGERYVTPVNLLHSPLTYLKAEGHRSGSWSGYELPAPRIVSVVVGDYGGEPGVTLDWNPVEEAIRYEVCRDGTPVVITVCTEFYDYPGLYDYSGVVAGRTYVYQVRALGVGVASDLSDSATASVEPRKNPPQEMAIRVILDGSVVSLPRPPLVRDGTTLVPLRAVAEALRAHVDYDDATQTVSVKFGGYSALVIVGDRRALANGLKATLEVPPAVVGGFTYVPVRFVAEALGATVTWDSATRTIALESENVSPSPPTLRAVSVVNGGIPGIELTWSTVPGATEYEICRDGVSLSNLDAGQTLFKDVGSLVGGQVYVYYGRTWSGNHFGPMSDAVWCMAPLEALELTAPEMLSPASRPNGEEPGLEIRWTSVTGAESYELFRDYVPLASCSATVYWDHDDLVPGVIYEYKVRAVAGDQVGPLSEGMRVEAPFTSGLDAPENLTIADRANGGDPGFDLFWLSVPGAVAYDVFRNNRLLCTCDITECWDYQGLVPGHAYRYCVRAVGPGGEVGPLSDEVSVTAEAPAPELTAPEMLPPVWRPSGKEPGLEIRWTSVPGAEIYELFRDEELLAYCATTLYWDHEDLVPGVIYEYKVRAVAGDRVGPLSEGMRVEAPFTSGLGVPGNLTIVASASADDPSGSGLTRKIEL